MVRLCWLCRVEVPIGTGTSVAPLAKANLLALAFVRTGPVFHASLYVVGGDRFRRGSGVTALSRNPHISIHAVAHPVAFVEAGHVAAQINRAPAGIARILRQPSAHSGEPGTSGKVGIDRALGSRSGTRNQ